MHENHVYILKAFWLEKELLPASHQTILCLSRVLDGLKTGCTLRHKNGSITCILLSKMFGIHYFSDFNS